MPMLSAIMALGCRPTCSLTMSSSSAALSCIRPMASPAFATAPSAMSAALS